MSLKQHGHFATNGFVFPLFRQMLQNTEKSTLNLWIVVNRIKCKRFLNSKPITRRRYIHTFIYERSFLACQTFQISNFTSEYTPLTSQNAHLAAFAAYKWFDCMLEMLILGTTFAALFEISTLWRQSQFHTFVTQYARAFKIFRIWIFIF